jgi:hypothetical protein
VLDLGPRLRAGFALVYVLVIVSVIVSAQWRPDHVFGFQMFNQSSTLEVHLAREVRGRAPIPVVGGSWRARDRSGRLREFRWDDRVKDSVLRELDVPVHAKYGLEAQLFRLQFALEDVLAHLPEDAETKGLRATVATTKNGRSSGIVHLRAERQ